MIDSEVKHFGSGFVSRVGHREQWEAAIWSSRGSCCGKPLLLLEPLFRTWPNIQVGTHLYSPIWLNSEGTNPKDLFLQRCLKATLCKISLNGKRKMPLGVPWLGGWEVFVSVLRVGLKNCDLASMPRECWTGAGDYALTGISVTRT